MSARPLRVAVTRDEPDDGPLATALRARGLEPRRCPVVIETASPEPEVLARAARELERYDWLIVASARAVHALARARDGAPFPAGVRTAAVGESTAEALRAHGARAPRLAPIAGAQALIAELREADAWTGKRVLLPRAVDGGQEMASSLAHWGASVDEVMAYGTAARSNEEILACFRAADPDAVVVASPSAARALIRAVGAESLRRLEPVIAIGPTTAMALVAQGIVAVVPSRADFDAMAALLVESRQRRNGAGDEMETRGRSSTPNAEREEKGRVA